MLLSAYLDDEVPERFARQIEVAIRNDERVRADYEALVELTRRLRVDPPVDLEQSGRRSWESIQARLEQPRPDVWHRRVAVPLPALAAAATVVFGLLGVLVWALLPLPAAPTDYFARGNDVDVTIRVDGTDMDQVLQWLVDKNILGEVSIQLPEQRFRIVGEPVFVKSAQFAGEVVR